MTKELDGNVLRIATRDTMKKEAEDRQALAKAESDAVPTVTTTRVLSYAKAGDVSTTLRRFLSARGDIFFDERSNTMIIRDIPASVPALDNLIRQLDRKAQQVEIEARVVLASRNFARDIGTQFGFSFTSTAADNVYGGSIAVGSEPDDSTRPLPPLVDARAAAMPLITNFPAMVRPVVLPLRTLRPILRWTT